MKKIRKILFSGTNFNEKLLILNISLIFGVSSMCFIGISVWFQTPEIYCRDHLTLKKFICTEDFACQNQKISYHIDKKKGPYSLSSELSFICEKKAIQRMLLSTMFAGGFLGCVLNALIVIPASKRKLALSFLCLAICCAKLGVLLMFENIYFLGFFLGMISFCAIISNSYCFALINETFAGEVAKLSTVIMALTWGMFGVFYGGISYLIESNWKVIFSMGSLMFFILATSLIFVKNEKGTNTMSAKEPENLAIFLVDLFKSKNDKNNFLIFLVIWLSTSMTYNDIILEIGNVGSNIYLNISIIALIEMLASYAAGYISMNFNVLSSFKNLLSFSFIFYTGFYFVPSKIQNILLVIVFMSCKFFSEILYNLTNIYTPRVVSEKYIAYFFIFTRLSSRTLLLFLPHINHVFDHFGIHPFVFLSLIYGLSRFLVEKVQEPSIVIDKGKVLYKKIENDEKK